MSSKGCWEYSSKLENPYSKLETGYSKLESPYSKLESTYSKLESPYSKLENPYSKLESHYSKLDSPYSKLESHYTSSLASQHFNNIKMDPQQGMVYLNTCFTFQPYSIDIDIVTTVEKGHLII